MGHVGNMNPEPKMAVFQLFNANGIIEITGCLSVDGHGQQLSKILSFLNALFIGLFCQLRFL